MIEKLELQLAEARAWHHALLMNVRAASQTVLWPTGRTCSLGIQNNTDVLRLTDTIISLAMKFLLCCEGDITKRYAHQSLVNLSLLQAQQDSLPSGDTRSADNIHLACSSGVARAPWWSPTSTSHLSEYGKVYIARRHLCPSSKCLRLETLQFEEPSSNRRVVDCTKNCFPFPVIVCMFFLCCLVQSVRTSRFWTPGLKSSGRAGGKLSRAGERRDVKPSSNLVRCFFVSLCMCLVQLRDSKAVFNPALRAYSSLLDFASQTFIGQRLHGAACVHRGQARHNGRGNRKRGERSSSCSGGCWQWGSEFATVHSQWHIYACWKWKVRTQFMWVPVMGL